MDKLYVVYVERDNGLTVKMIITYVAKGRSLFSGMNEIVNEVLKAQSIEKVNVNSIEVVKK